MLASGRARRILPIALLVVTAQAMPYPAEAAFAGRNGKIVFASYDGMSHIYTVSPSGSRLSHLRHSGADPSWSPDGRSIAFTDRTRDSEAAIFTMRGDGTRVRRATPERLTAYEAAWSPDGEQLVFTVAVGMTEDLYVMDLAEGLPRKLTHLPGYEFQAAWSPNGEHIAFVASDALFLTSDIYTVAADGSDLQRVTTAPHEDKYSPGWSPDGGTLVYEAIESTLGDTDLFLVGADGSDVRRLTDTSWEEQWPSFSPDGTRLLFGSDKDGDFDIYTIRTDGSSLRKITDNHTDERVADWQPR